MEHLCPSRGKGNTWHCGKQVLLGSGTLGSERQGEVRAFKYW
jgi:hypothetical protein